MRNEEWAGDRRFFRTFPSSSEQMLDPQASTSMDPLKLPLWQIHQLQYTVHVHALKCSFSCSHIHTNDISILCTTVMCNKVMQLNVWQRDVFDCSQAITIIDSYVKIWWSSCRLKNLPLNEFLCPLWMWRWIWNMMVLQSSYLDLALIKKTKTDF